MPPREVGQDSPWMDRRAQTAGVTPGVILSQTPLSSTTDGGGKTHHRSDPLVPTPKPTKSLERSSLAFPVFRLDTYILNECLARSGKNK